MTDGVSAVVDTYQAVAGWREALDIGRTDPEHLITLVHNTELADPKAEKWPRGKIHDDKALAVITF